ncbi:MAG: magnesium transporter [Promethearchaeia archaeon]
MKVDRNRLIHLGHLYGRSVLSLLFNLGGLLAGLFLASSTSIIASVSWALLLYPSILSVKGAIGGLFSGRLSTALHMGTIKPSLRDNTEHFYVLVSAMASLSLITAVVMWMYAWGFGLVLIGLEFHEIIEMFFVMLATVGLAFIVIIPTTILLSFVALRKSLDPDVVTYPIISTVADIVVTVIYLSLIAISRTTVCMTGIIGIAVVFTVICLGVLWNNRSQEMLKKTIKEFIGVLFVIGFFVTIAGSALDRINQVVLRIPHIYAVYPAIIDTVGDVGSIVGSLASTKLSLGTIGATLSSFRSNLSDIACTWLASVTMFVGYGLISAQIFRLFHSTIFLVLLVQLILANVISVSIILLFSSVLTLWTFKRGLDPDNFINPILSAVSDGITSLSLLLVVVLVG